MAKYKVGDKVLVRSDLRVGRQYGRMSLLSGMSKFCGTVVTIEKVKSVAYKVEGYDNPFFTDEMFVGLADETPTESKNKLKVGDRFVVTKAKIQPKERFIGEIFTVRSLNPNGKSLQPHYGVENEKDCHFVWFEDEVELVKESSPAAQTEPLTVNINIDIYANSCWYCRKGGLVDLYLDGRPGICPSCGRVCNDSSSKLFDMKKIGSKIIEFKPKKENKQLTKDELYALPDGTRVFTVWCEGGEERWDDDRTRWRIKSGNNLNWETGSGHIRISSDSYYKAYLEEPVRP